MTWKGLKQQLKAVLFTPSTYFCRWNTFVTFFTPEAEKKHVKVKNWTLRDVSKNAAITIFIEYVIKS